MPQFIARQETFNRKMWEFKTGQEAFNTRTEQHFENLETKIDHLLGDNAKPGWSGP